MGRREDKEESPRGVCRSQGDETDRYRHRFCDGGGEGVNEEQTQSPVLSRGDRVRVVMVTGPRQGSEDKVWEAEEGSGRRGWGRLRGQTQSSAG